MARRYYDKDGRPTGYSVSDIDAQKKNKNEMIIAFVVGVVTGVGYLIYWLYGQAIQLISAVNDPSNLIQPYRFLAYYCNYVFFSPFRIIGGFWNVVITNGLTKFHNLNYIIFFSVLVLIPVGLIYALSRLKRIIQERVISVALLAVAFPLVILIAYWIYLIIAAIFGWIFA